VIFMIGTGAATNDMPATTTVVVQMIIIPAASSSRSALTTKTSIGSSSRERGSILRDAFGGCTVHRNQ